MNNTKLKLSEYVVLDVETPNRKNNSICQIGIIQVKNNEVVYEKSLLINPEDNFEELNMSIHHISKNMVKDSITFDIYWEEIKDIIENNIIVGHGIKFDISVIAKALKKYNIELPKIQIICTQKLARNYLNVKKQSLDYISDYLNIDLEHHHNAFDDVKATMKIFEYIKDNYDISESDIEKYSYEEHEKVDKKTTFSETTHKLQELKDIVEKIMLDNKIETDEINNLKQWLNENLYLSGNYPFDKINTIVTEVLEDEIITINEINELNDVFVDFINPIKGNSNIVEFANKIFCLTGAFDYGQKKDVADIIINKGGTLNESVTGKIDYLIVGGSGSSDWKFGNYGSKVQRALEFNEKEKNIKIISEKDFFDNIDSGITEINEENNNSIENIISEKKNEKKYVIKDQFDCVYTFYEDYLEIVNEIERIKISYEPNHNFEYSMFKTNVVQEDKINYFQIFYLVTGATDYPLMSTTFFENSELNKIQKISEYINSITIKYYDGLVYKKIENNISDAFFNKDRKQLEQSNLESNEQEIEETTENTQELKIYKPKNVYINGQSINATFLRICGRILQVLGVMFIIVLGLPLLSMIIGIIPIGIGIALFLVGKNYVEMVNTESKINKEKQITKSTNSFKKYIKENINATIDNKKLESVNINKLLDNGETYTINDYSGSYIFSSKSLEKRDEQNNIVRTIYYDKDNMPEFSLKNAELEDNASYFIVRYYKDLTSTYYSIVTIFFEKKDIEMIKQLVDYLNEKAKDREEYDLELQKQKEQEEYERKYGKNRYSKSQFSFLDNDNNYLKYKYYDIPVKGIEYIEFDISKVPIDEDVKFELEPNNKYDSNAIKIICNNMFIGYVPKNNIQSMIIKYLESEENYVSAYISKVNEFEKTIELGIGFYNELSESELKTIPHIDTTLIKTTKKDEYDISRQDNYSTLEENEEVSVDEQYDSDLYLVTDMYGNELGELSQSVSEKMSDYAYGYSKYAYVLELKETSSGSSTAKIRILFIED